MIVLHYYSVCSFEKEISDKNRLCKNMLSQLPKLSHHACLLFSYILHLHVHCSCIHLNFKSYLLTEGLN